MPRGLIISSISGNYNVRDLETKEEYKCRARGVFRNKKITPLVGDYVDFSIEDNQEGYILKIEDRKNELVRPPISNVDQALLVFSTKEPEFSNSLLDRLLAIIEYNNIEPVIIVSKDDLTDDFEFMQNYIEYYKKIGYKVLVTSSFNKIGIDSVKELMKDKITVLAGQSGVGKSSLLNALNEEFKLRTAEISKALGRGRHTTRHVELYSIDSGLVADTPGFSKLDFSNISVEELSNCFIEFYELSDKCKFRNCTHINEPKCAVKQAVDNNEILKSRYKNYLNIINEIKSQKPKYY